MNSILEETQFILKKYQIKANKSLGQNFLINDEVVNQIMIQSDINKQDLVIEIGPGLGTLTKPLLEKAGKVICVELDPKMVTILNDRFSLYQNFEIINEDILTVDLKELMQREKQNSMIQSVKVVANLPYYITTPIMMKLVEERLPIETITVMMQKEVADRLIAIPGKKNTGAITYAVNYYAASEKILEVPNHSFIPQPEVTSEVIQLKIRKQPIVQVKDEAFFFHVIKMAFRQRRKTLVNGLVNHQLVEDKPKAIALLQELGMKETIRPEELTLADFAKLANKINE